MKTRPYHANPKRPNRLKRNIHVDWLGLDPDELKREMPIQPEHYVLDSDVRKLAAQNFPLLAEAYWGWCGINGRPGGTMATFVGDWEDFLTDLAEARRRAGEANFEPFPNGRIFRTPRA